MLLAGILVGRPGHVGTQVASAQEQTTNSGCWTSYPTVSPGGSGVALSAIEAISPDDIWAVGKSTPPNSKSLTWIQHWDGAKWTQVASPSPGAVANGLNGLTVIGPNDLWAVGAYGDADTEQKTLILRWNGTIWSVVDSPSPEPRMSVLQSVDGTAANDVWAVGYYAGGNGVRRPLILHWDGAKWAQSTDLPELRGETSTPNGVSLSSVTAVSPDDVWAVGFVFSKPLILRWDGSKWSQAAVPSSIEFGSLDSVTAVGPQDVWAVGITKNDPLILHWDGRAWTVSPFAPVSPGGPYHPLRSVAARSKDDVWAVGTDVLGLKSGSMILLMHWDGATWTQVPDTSGAPATAMGADVAPNGDLWIVGSAGLLARRANGPCKPLDPPVPLPGNGRTIYPQTGKTVSGIFLDYWLEHGGLPQQGYPISEVIGEVSDLDRKTYTMQYFERAVFEYHPENKPPYNVLLSQLGTFEYRKKYPNGAPNQKPSNDPNSILFNQTGKRLGGKFLDYWRTHGGLPQQGYPISDEFTEVSPLDGKPYTVQYFERAVFELHPENQPPYDILLSHLGRFRYDARYGGASSPISIARNVTDVVQAGSFVFWVDNSNPSQPLNGYDLELNSRFMVTERAGRKDQIATDGKMLVWLEDQRGRQKVVRQYDISARREISSNIQFAEGVSSGLAVDNGTLYYHGMVNGVAGLYAHNLGTGQVTLLVEHAGSAAGTPVPTPAATSFGRIVARDGALVWSQTKSYGGSRPGEARLHVHKLDGSIRNMVIATETGGANLYDVSGDYIVWSFTSFGGEHGSTPYLYNLKTGQKKAIADWPANSITILGEVVVWSAALVHNVRDWSIEAYGISSEQRWTVVPARKTALGVAGITPQNQLVFKAATNESQTSWDLYLVAIK